MANFNQGDGTEIVAALNEENVEAAAALAYIAARPAIREVILTGGDPLSLSERRLTEVIDRLNAIPHLDSLRIHSRIPVVAPGRITEALAGALADPADGAVLLFQGDSPAAAEAFAAADPYVREGLVTHWRVRTWMTVVGEGAAHPVP